MEARMEAERRENIPELESRWKTNVEVLYKSDKEILRILAGCGVSARFWGARKSDILPLVWDQVKEFLERGSIFLQGPPGIGKTHIAAALMREKVTDDNETIYHPGTGDGIIPTHYLPSYPRMISVPDLLLEIRECFNSCAEGSETSLIEKYASRKCLILDDLGVEKTSEWSIQTLYSIVDRRYRDVRQTLITSNLTLDEISEKVGDRIASRIAGMCKVVEIRGRDRRIKKT